MSNYKIITDDEERNNFIPELVGQDMMMLMQFENFIYSKLDNFTDEYSGGYFQFLEFDNGAKAIVCSLNKSEKVTVKPQPNYYQGETDIKSLCIAANLFACSNFSFSGSKGAESVGNNYHLLREAITGEFDLEAIFGILD